jgi:hypothetical protein
MSANTNEDQNRNPHTPLGCTRDIRLVQIVSKVENPDGFELELSTTSLNDPIPYVALSYTWEAAELDRATGHAAPASEHSIVCDQSTIKVTQNLLDFLRRALYDVTSPRKHYWIDQISINQSDLTERLQQVAMMGSIYKAAESVHIWLGNNDPYPEFLWVYQSFIPSVLRLESELRDRGISLGSDSWDCSTPELIEGLGVEMCKQWQESYESFFWFFYTRRWFLRAWILQEVTLKDTSLIHVSCGRSDLDWKVFDNFTRFVERNSWHHSLPLLYIPWAEKRSGPMVPLLNLLKSRHYIDMKTRGGSELDTWLSNFVWDVGPQNERQIWYSIFLHFLKTTRFMSTKNPTDHVYSLLGMMAEFLPPGMECPISPNYGTSTVSVFKDFATLIFKNTPSLYLLSTVHYGLFDGRISNPGDRRDWPSWVPDFSNESSFGPSLSTAVYLISSGARHYNASRLDAMTYHSPTIRGDVLTVHGARIDIIEKCNDRRKVVSGSENLPCLSFIIELCIRGTNMYPNSNQTWFEAVWRTMLVDCIPPSWDSEPPVLFRSWLLDHTVRALKFKGRGHDESSFQEGKERVVKLLQRVSEDIYLSSMLPTLDEVVDQVRSDVEQDSVENHPFELLACESFSGMRWYLTTSGFLGSGPISLGQEDEVWLLNGGKMPMILRRVVENQYMVVGESYLHGAMYGELMTNERAAHMGPIEII